MTQEIISVPLDSLADEGLHSADPSVEDGEELDAPLEKRPFSVEPEAHGARLDKYLAEHCAEFSRGYFQYLLEDGAVELNGGVVRKAATKVKAGDQVRVELRPTAQAQAFQAEQIPLTVCYEDEHLMVVDKPAGLVVHPAAGNWTGTLLNALLAYHGAASRLPRAGIVHRLDKDTSGLMLVGKTQQAVDALVRMIAERQVHRIYVALAHGRWRREDEVLVNQPIGRDPRNRLRMAVLPEGNPTAKVAQTQVRVLAQGDDLVWVGCKLHTGRTHQIRVHMAWLGHPLVGDIVYGGRACLGVSRQALHAHRLVLAHPVTGQLLRLESPLPADLAQAVQSAGLHYNPDHLWRVEAA